MKKYHERGHTLNNSRVAFIIIATIFLLVNFIGFFLGAFDSNPEQKIVYETENRV